MARLHGSIPLKFNGKVIGKGYIIGHDNTGFVVDMIITDDAVLNSLSEILKADHDSMSFAVVHDDKPELRSIPETRAYQDRS